MPRHIYFRRILGFMILVATAATFVVIIRYFIDNSRKEKKNLPKSISADLSLKTIHFTESQNDLKKWELFANSGIYDKPKEKTTLEGIQFIVERRSKNSPITVTARHGEYQHLPKIVVLSGTVNASTTEGLTFETSRLAYDSASQTFSTNERIKLTDAALSVEGTGMELSVEKQRAVVKERVDAIIYPGKRTQ